MEELKQFYTMISDLAKHELIKHLIDLFTRANSYMLRRNIDEICNDVSERSICADLKTEMDILLRKSPLFEGYYVDVEYNRGAKGYLKAINDDGKPKIISCDLIIHSRGKRKIDNLLCLEMKKKKASRVSKENDKKRLMALTSTCGVFNITGNAGRKTVVSDYILGIYYEYDRKNKDVLLVFYFNGQPIYTDRLKLEEYIIQSPKMRRIINEVLSKTKTL